MAANPRKCRPDGHHYIKFDDYYIFCQRCADQQTVVTPPGWYWTPTWYPPYRWYPPYWVTSTFNTTSTTWNDSNITTAAWADIPPGTQVTLTEEASS